MITARNMDELLAELEAIRIAAANGSLDRGRADVFLDRVNTARNCAFDTPYLRTLDAIYAEVEALEEKVGHSVR